MPYLIHNTECSIWQRIHQCLYILIQMINAYISRIIELSSQHGLTKQFTKAVNITAILLSDTPEISAPIEGVNGSTLNILNSKFFLDYIQKITS